MIHRTILLVLAAAVQLALGDGVVTGSDDGPDDAMRSVLERAVNVKPHARQVAWQEMEFTCFVHFGVNTFSGREWGTGKEDPATFNPTELDARQWARSARDAGMKMIILTAKHHDGFCLWPSRYTEHSVAHSPFREGKGDVVREVVVACHEFGLKVGVYLSPADLYQIESTKGYYGNKSKPKRCRIPTLDHVSNGVSFEVAADDYNRYFMNQLYELLTEYGPIREVWFDGANPKPGTGQTYKYLEWYRIIRTLQPQAAIFGKAPDVRWVGNEGGRTRPSEWSVVPIDVEPAQFTGGDKTAEDLGSREKIKDAKHLIWYPAETDVSIRPGWFYHADQDAKVRSTANILDMWYHAAGGNAVLLLNVPPDKRGLFHETDVRRLKEVGDVLRATFRNNLAEGAVVNPHMGASLIEHYGDHAPANILDGKTSTCWKVVDWTPTGKLVIQLDGEKEFDRAVLQEPISQFGQRVEQFVLEAWVDGEWQQIADATVIGYKRILRFDPVRTDKVRIRITESRISPAIATFGLYRSSE